MTTIELDTLLDWAATNHWHLFPLAPGSKMPMQGSSGWKDATDDVEQITAWYAAHPGANWAVATGPSGLLVVDIDEKGGKHGRQAWREWCDANGVHRHETYIVETPTGGFHLYYTGDGPSTANRLGRGVDTRGAGGYVVAAGSVVQEGAYQAIGARVPAIPMPGPLENEIASWGLQEAADEDLTPVVVLDEPTALVAAADWLRQQDGAIEGQGGDEATYKIACAVKDMGISEDGAVDLMLATWNERCVPPWEPDELARKVRNAYQYGTRAPGVANPEAVFSPIPLDERGTPMGDTGILAVTADTFDPYRIPRRPWILGNRLIEGFVTVTIAPGGVGKSTFTILEAMAVACGMDLTGDEVVRPGAVWLYNTEDPLDELQRRICAAAAHHGLEMQDLNRMHVTSGLDRPLRVVTDYKAEGLMIDVPLVKAVTNYIEQHDIRVLVVDPFVEAHGVDENDNAAVAQVVQVFRQIAVRTRCAISLVHHTRKAGAGEQRTGHMDMARGASSLVSAARIVHTLAGMSEEEASEHGIAEDRRRWYVRLDDAKANLAPPADEVRWFERVSIELPNGEYTGTLRPTNLVVVDVPTGMEELLDTMVLLADEGELADDGMSVPGVCKACADAFPAAGSARTLSRRLKRTFDNLGEAGLNAGDWQLYMRAAGASRRSDRIIAKRNIFKDAHDMEDNHDWLDGHDGQEFSDA